MTKKRTPLIALQFGKQFQDAKFDMSTSLIHTDNISGTGTSQRRNKKKIHGHIFSNLKMDLNENWRATGRIERVSSSTYLKKYQFLEGPQYYSKNYLTSVAEVERFDRTNYFVVRGLDFQNLNAAQRNDTTPFVAPMIGGSYVTDVGTYGERWNLDFDQVYIDRDRGNRTERFGVKPGFKVYKITNNGLIHEVESYLSADMYDIKKYDNSTTGRRVNQGLVRTFPGLSWIMRYPLCKKFNNKKWVFTPIVGLVALPNAVNNHKIPNNDSQDFEFDTSNLFLINRFPGRDQIDDGQRLNYALTFDLFERAAQKLKIIFGQSYSFSKKRNFEEGSGITKGASDYVGKAHYIANEFFSTAWSFRLGRASFKPKRNRSVLLQGQKSLSLARAIHIMTAS